MALVSIITPCLNGARYLRNCLDSVRYALLEQDYEQVVVDGGSTDDSLAILRQYPEVRFRSEPDGGMYDALNKGLQMAHGEIVGHLNTDEQYNREGLLAALARIRQDNVQAVFGRTVVVDEQLEFLQLLKQVVIPRVVDTHWCMPVQTCSLLYRRTVWERFPYESSYRLAGDHAWFRRQLEAGLSMGRVRLPVGIFTWHTQNVSRASEYVNRETAVGDIHADSWAIWLAKQIYHLRKFWHGGYRRSPISYAVFRGGKMLRIRIPRPDLRGKMS